MATTSGSQWDGTAYATQARHHREHDDWFLDRCPPGPEDVVVDLGCGSGEFTARLARGLPAGRVIGVDADAAMLDAARRHDLPNLELVEAPAEELDAVVPAGSVDLVVSRAMLHWLPISAYPRVFRAVGQVLRPGGWFHSESGGAGNIAQIETMLNDLADRFGLDRLSGFPDAGAALDLVEAAGFRVPTEGVRTVAQRRSFDRDGIVGLLRTQASVALTRATDEETADAIRQACVDDVERLQRHDGTYDQTFVRLEILAERP